MKAVRAIAILWVCLLGLAVGSVRAETQESVVPIEVTVTRVTGPLLTVDRGSSSGFAVGDLVRFRSLAGLVREGVVISLTESAAQVELNDLTSDASLAVGQRGEVLVPASRARPDGSGGGKRGVPEHPPWPEPVGPWAPGQPLLAPARSPGPEERAPQIRGRLFTRYEYTDHLADGFPTSCEECHDTSSWEGASFNHPGITSGCAQCHQADYNATANPGHAAAGFLTTCEFCHDTRGWVPADFDHGFPIDGGDHAGFDCSDCHTNPGNFATFSCTHCHQHGQSEMAGEHEGVPGYVWESSACYSCHPNGDS